MHQQFPRLQSTGAQWLELLGQALLRIKSASGGGARSSPVYLCPVSSPILAIIFKVHDSGADQLTSSSRVHPIRSGQSELARDLQSQYIIKSRFRRSHGYGSRASIKWRAPIDREPQRISFNILVTVDGLNAFISNDHDRDKRNGRLRY